MANGPDWAHVRSLFPVAGEGAYLDTATYGPGPRAALEATHEAVDLWASGRGSWPDWEAVGEDCRRLFARFLGAPAESVALLPALSVAAAQVAEALPLRAHRPAPNLVVGEGEFRSNLFPWMNQERRGFEVRSVPFRDGGPALADVLAQVDEHTALVALSHVQSSNGFRLDVEALAPRLAERGVRLFLDATQSVGALRIPLDGVDYLATAGYKWLLAPRGGAFLYVRPELVGEMHALAPGWKTPQDPYAGYYGPPYEPAERAARFDVSLAWPIWPGARASLELLCELGAEAIERRDLELAGRFRARLPELGLAPLFPPERSSPIVGLRVPDPEAVRAALLDGGVSAAVRGGYLRVSFHLFNDEGDVERAVLALARAQRSAS